MSCFYPLPKWPPKKSKCFAHEICINTPPPQTWDKSTTQLAPHFIIFQMALGVLWPLQSRAQENKIKQQHNIFLIDI